MAKKTIPQNDPASQTPKLTPFQRIALELAAGRYGVWNRHHDNEFRTNVAALQVLRKLEKLGLVEPINSGDTCWTVQFVATDLGRAVLRAADAESSAVPCPVCGGKGFFDTFDERNTTHSTETCEACGGSGHVTPARSKELKDAMYPFDAASSAAPTKDGGR